MTAEIQTPLPLEGIKVIELSHLIAGPYCAQLMAEEGAQVIKVEPPEGELSRHREPIRRGKHGSASGYFCSFNRGKQSIALDLKTPEGIEIFKKLLQTADVFITNMRVNALGRLGIHPKDLHAQYPRLVIACISGFGMENAGEYTDRAALAMVAEAMSGSTGLTRDHAGNPIWCGFAQGDILAGMTAHSAILLALRNQDRHGLGRIIDLGLVECTLPMVALALGREQGEQHDASADATSTNTIHGIPYGTYPASDGYVNIGVNRDALWRSFCKAIGRPELGNDERYASFPARAQHRDEVREITESFTKARTRAKITSTLTEFDVPVASILSMGEVVKDEYLRRRGALCEVDDGVGGTFIMPADPTGFPAKPEARRVPRLGEHRDAVLINSLSLDASQIAHLAEMGVFGKNETITPIKTGGIEQQGE